MKPWYDKIMAEINKFGKDVEAAPKKAYVSLRRKKQFALIQPSTKDRLDIGLNIKELSLQVLLRMGKSGMRCVRTASV